MWRSNTENQEYVWVVSWKRFYYSDTEYKVFTNKQSALNFKYSLLNSNYYEVELEKRYD